MKKGFTLIELLVVITILAVLAGAALPYVQSYVEESRIAKAKTDLEEIARALAVYETREGDYPDTPTPADPDLSDVSQLTGRYLNKAPIDPWGSAYIVSLNEGIVYSLGPDRDDTAPGKYDNISMPYQPPLALVAAKWVDKNQSGAFDAQNVPDQLHLVFSRKLNRVTADCITANLNAWFQLSPDGDPLNEEDIQANFVQSITDAGAYPPVILVDNPKTLVLSLKDAFDPTANPISIGAAYIKVDDPKGPDGNATTDPDNLSDKAKNLCLDGQQVKILPQ